MKPIQAFALSLPLAFALTMPVWAEGNGEASLGDFLLGTVEGAMLLSLLLTVIFMVGYILWRRRKKK